LAGFLVVLDLAAYLYLIDLHARQGIHQDLPRVCPQHDEVS
jgi:hypothetical protein